MFGISVQDIGQGTTIDVTEQTSTTIGIRVRNTETGQKIAQFMISDGAVSSVCAAMELVRDHSGVCLVKVAEPIEDDVRPGG